MIDIALTAKFAIGADGAPVSVADRVIKWSTAGAVLGVAAAASYAHAYDLVRAHGEAGWTASLIPLTVDGLIYVSSMVMLDSARRKPPVPALPRWLLSLAIAATLAFLPEPTKEEREIRTCHRQVLVGAEARCGVPGLVSEPRG